MSAPQKHGLRRGEFDKDDPEQVFEMLEVVGEGSYGLICTCKNVKDQKIYAIKFLDIEEEGEPALQKEIDILKESQGCSNIVHYFGCYVKDNTLMIVMEYCEGGSALDIIKYCNFSFSESQVAAMLADMVDGLTFLHNHKVMHRDLKAGNVLLTTGGVAKLADFGVSAKLTRTMEKKKTTVGSPYWMAPEVITTAKDQSS